MSIIKQKGHLQQNSRNAQRKYTHMPFQKKKSSKIKTDKVEGHGHSFLCPCQAALAMLKVMWSLQLPSLTLIRYVREQIKSSHK